MKLRELIIMLFFMSLSPQPACLLSTFQGLLMPALHIMSRAFLDILRKNRKKCIYYFFLCKLKNWNQLLVHLSEKECCYQEISEDNTIKPWKIKVLYRSLSLCVGVYDIRKKSDMNWLLNRLLNSFKLLNCFQQCLKQTMWFSHQI